MTERRRVSKVSDEELLAAAEGAANMRQLLRTLGIAAYGGNYESIRLRLARLGGLPRHLAPRPPCVLEEASDEQVRDAVMQAVTLAGALRTLGYAPTPTLSRALSRRIRAAGFDVSHMLGRGWSRGLPGQPRIPLEDVLVRGSTYQTHDLRLRLLREGVMQHVCACCERSEWQGRPIPLELDHIDGDRSNNELSNLRLLCPNCHAQTDTYRGRNVGRPHGVSPLDEGKSDSARDRALARVGRILNAA
jgi:hypothetical protein